MGRNSRVEGNRFMASFLKFLKTQRNAFDLSNKLIKIKHFSCQKNRKENFITIEHVPIFINVSYKNIHF